MKDTRKHIVTGESDSKSDIDETFRFLVIHHGENLAKMKAFTDSQVGISLSGLLKLSVHLGLKFECDSLHQSFSIFYAPKGVKLIEVTEKEKETFEEIEEEPVSPALNIKQKVKKVPAPKSEIKPDEAPKKEEPKVEEPEGPEFKDEDEDLF